MSSSPKKTLLASLLLVGCQQPASAPTPPPLVQARQAARLPAPLPGPDLYLTPTQLIVSDHTLREATKKNLAEPLPGPPSSHTIPLDALPDDTLLIAPLQDALASQQATLRHIERHIIDEELSLPPRLRVFIHPDTPHALLLRVLYTAGQAELVDPQLILDSPQGPRAITLDTPRIGSPSAPQGAPSPLDLLKSLDGDCHPLTIALRSDKRFIAPPASPTDAPCVQVTFAADNTLAWRDVAPAMEDARLTATNGQLYLAVEIR